MPNKLLIYTDGSTLASGAGPSGYGVVIKDGPNTVELGAGYKLSTNNRMELMGVIAALEGLNYPRRIIVTSDSQYVKDGIERNIHVWRARDWITSIGTPVKNKDLWLRLYEATLPHIIQWDWVKGHSGHPENERCDVIAKEWAGKGDLIDAGYVPHPPNTSNPYRHGNPNQRNRYPWWKKK